MRHVCYVVQEVEFFAIVKIAESDLIMQVSDPYATIRISRELNKGKGEVILQQPLLFSWKHHL